VSRRIAARHDSVGSHPWAESAFPDLELSATVELEGAVVGTQIVIAGYPAFQLARIEWRIAELDTVIS
jgi:hypothetical protein